MAKVINVVYKVDDKALLKAKTEIQGIEKETKDSEKEMLKLNNAINKVGAQGSQSMLSFKNIIASIGTAAIIAGVVQLGRKIFELGVKQEQTNIAFSTFLGSAEKAKALLGELTKFSIITPFTPDQVNSSARALLAFGVQAKDIIPTLKMLGDVSSGTGKDLTEMAIIFGQIRSTGRLMGQDLLQLINAGFNPLQIISEKTGRSVAQLKKDMENGLITFDMVSQAFKSATSEGGLFFNLMEKQSQSVGGKLSTIEGNLEEIGKKLFENNSGPISETIGLIADLTSNVDGLANAFNNWIKFVTKTNLVLQVLSFINDELKEAELSNQKFMMAVLQQEKANLKINQTLEERRKTTERIVYLETQLGIRKPGTTEDPLPWVTEKKSNDIDKVADKTDKLTAAQIKARQEFMKMMGFKTGADRYKENADADEKESKRKSDAITDELKQDADRAEVIKANNKDMEDEITRQLEESADERIRIANEEAANREAAIQRSYDLAIQLSAALLENALMEREIDTQSISNKYEKELELAGDNDRAKKEIEKKREAELQAAEERNKEIQKKNAKTKILIDTAVAVIKTMAEFGYPWGLIPAALMAGFAAVQIRNVNKYKDGEIDIKGPGTTTSDSINAKLSKGESVINAAATSKSKNLLEAINNRKIDDSILQNVAANGGSRAVEFDYARMGEEFRKGKEQYDTQGYTIMKGIQKGKNFKMFIRSKVQGYK